VCENASVLIDRETIKLAVMTYGKEVKKKSEGAGGGHAPKLPSPFHGRTHDGKARQTKPMSSVR